MLRSPEMKRIMRYPNFTMVGHHYVLPIAKEHRGEIQGSVHRTSASNETVFIEPQAIAEHSAQLSYLRAREAKEIRRILRPGGRIGITYRLCYVELENLAKVFAPVPDIYPSLRGAIGAAGLPIVAEKVWIAEPRLSEALLAAFEERFLPRIPDDLRGRRSARQSRAVELTLTMIAEKVSR